MHSAPNDILGWLGAGKVGVVYWVCDTLHDRTGRTAFPEQPAERCIL